VTIEEIYNYADKIGVLVFSTIHNNEVHSRVAHFNGYDEDGIYFRTMYNKPFAKQLKKTGKVTVAGISSATISGHDADGIPSFPPSYSFRLIGEVREVSPETIIKKAETNSMLKTAVTDMGKYPAMKYGNFVIYRAKIEVFDVDFEMLNRDHKLLRKRASFGGMKFNPAGVRITDKCIACGKCFEVCSFKAIIPGNPYNVNPERCDDCGSCLLVCPVEAIKESLVF
jgi:ferredoxin